MNVLFITRVDLNGKAGDSTHVRELILNIAKYINSATVLSSTDFEDKFSIDNIKFKKGRSIKISFLMSPSFSIYAFVLGFYILLTSKYDIIYERHHVFGTGCRLGKIFKIPCITEVNGITTDEHKMTGMPRKIITTIESNTFSMADKIVVVTSKIKETLQNEYDVPENKIVVIENGANTDLFKPMDISKARKELKFDQDANYICFVGHLVPWQGVVYLIQSAPLILKEIPNTKFLIVGDGPKKKELMELTEQTGVYDKFIFTGAVPYEEVPKYINASDVCVAPSARDERNKKSGGSSLKIYEYLACEKPVVTGNLDGDKDLILESTAGYVVSAENTTELANAIIKLLKNKELREEMGKNGRKCVVENYSWEDVAKSVEEVGNKVIEGRK